MSNSFAKKGYFLNKIKYNKDDDSMSIYIKLLKHFVKGKEVFFGFYRTDGINLTNEEWLKYDKEIPEYFQKYGRYEPLVETVEKRGKIKIYSGYLTVGSLPVNEETFEMLPKVFHCYLETILFCPKIDWDTFVQSYRDYMKHGASEYIMDGYADFLFTYADSGVFSISFDTNVYDPKTAHKEINKIKDRGTVHLSFSSAMSP